MQVKSRVTKSPSSEKVYMFYRRINIVSNQKTYIISHRYCVSELKALFIIAWLKFPLVCHCCCCRCVLQWISQHVINIVNHCSFEYPLVCACCSYAPQRLFPHVINMLEVNCYYWYPCVCTVISCWHDCIQTETHARTYHAHSLHTRVHVLVLGRSMKSIIASF